MHAPSHHPAHAGKVQHVQLENPQTSGRRAQRRLGTEGKDEVKERRKRMPPQMDKM